MLVPANDFCVPRIAVDDCIRMQRRLCFSYLIPEVIGKSMFYLYVSCNSFYSSQIMCSGGFL